MLKVTCAFIIHKNKILITQNGEGSDHAFQWEFPGGKIKKKETETDCIKREIREELDVEIEILQAMKSVIHNYGNKEIKLIPFLCKLKGGKMVLKEHNDFYWAKLNEFKDFDFSNADRKVLQLEENKKILEEHIRK